jgi:uncharacterized protein (TIGR02646 family)
MRRLTRPGCPITFAPAAEAELTKAQLHFEDTGRSGGFKFKAYKHPEVKAALSKMSSDKCAYCEADYDVTQPSDLEHFRPKGAIETDAGLRKPGYWWLAARWDNLLPSCIRCNRKETLTLFDGSRLLSGKGNRFPLNDEERRAHVVGGESMEEPLLIDPCREDPSDFIRFVDNDGNCIAVPVDEDQTSLSAQRARASIDTYGLNRFGLVRDRSRYMGRAKLSLARIERFVRRLDRLPLHREEDRNELECDIADELKVLDDLTCGEDRYTGMLSAVVTPVLAEFNLLL